MEEDIEELKRLFYANSLTQYGKRKLINYYEQRYKKLEEENKQLRIDNTYKLCEECSELVKQAGITKEDTNRILKEYRDRVENSIPASVIQNKIDELNRRIDYLNTELNKCYIEREKLGTETDIDNNETYIFYMEEEKNFREKQEEVLQELLREE